MSSASETPHNLMQENLLSMSEAARRLPPGRFGRRVNPSTIWRWIVEGVKTPTGQVVNLEGVRLAGRWLTSVQALERFVQAQTVMHQEAAGRPAAAPAPPAPRSPGDRRLANKRAAKALAAAGI